MARKNKTNKEGKNMKQFFKQLAAGVGAILIIGVAIFLLRGLSLFFIQVTAWVKIEEIIQNLPWIILGMIAFILVQGLGALVIYFFAPNEKIRRAKRSKIQRMEISRREGRRNAEEGYAETYDATPNEEVEYINEESIGRDDTDVTYVEGMEP